MLARQPRLLTPCFSAITTRPTTISAFVGTYLANSDLPQIARAVRASRCSPSDLRIARQASHWIA